MNFEIFSSDSDSDLEVLAMLSDWDNSSNDDSSDSMDEIDSESHSSDDEFKENISELNGDIVNGDNLNNESSANGENRNKRALKLRRVNYMRTLEDAEFTFTFRLSKTIIEPLLLEIMPYVRVTSARNNGVTPFHQLLLTLRFYAIGPMLSTVAEFVGVSKSTACRVVRDISSAISMLYDKYVFMHTEGMEKFYSIARFPKVIGVIDSIHIKIDSPRHDIGSEFRNQHGSFSVNVQAVCDADLKLMNVFCQSGSYHDSILFNSSPLKGEFESGHYKDCWLLGDSEYQNRWYLLTPIINPNTESERRYNEAHVKTRTAIERTLEVWKRRFPVLGLTLRLSLPVIQSVIMATAILHNICIINNVVDVPPESTADDQDPGNVDTDNIMDTGNPVLLADNNIVDDGDLILETGNHVLDAYSDIEDVNHIIGSNNILEPGSHILVPGSDILNAVTPILETGNQAVDTTNSVLYSGIDVQNVNCQETISDVKHYDIQDSNNQTSHNNLSYGFDSHDFDMRAYIVSNYFK